MATRQLFGKRLRQLRRRNNDSISLADVADAIGCSVTYVSAIERGDRNPPTNDKIQLLLEFLGEEKELNEMLELAVLARRSIEIPVKGTGTGCASMLLGLARRIEDGGLQDDDPLLSKFQQLLDSEKDSEDS